MEKAISPEERIRRAEEIYYRRKMQTNGVRVTSTMSTNQKSKPSYSLFKKMILQILICLVIYFIFYLVQDTNYVFSEGILNKTKEVLSYDMNFNHLYQEAITYINTLRDKIEGKQENNQQEQTQDNHAENLSNPQTEENIGGAEENTQNVVTTQENVNLSQMEIDSNAIKQNYTLIKPIEGRITSRFGPRNPTTASVPKNHTGIDIAANTGTVIQAALDGIVELASSEGDYGNHLKIVKDDVAIIYAHCSKLYLKQGDVVKQGDNIAEVGATGNVTGPHLHFEIRKDGRYVNPDNILTFE